MDGIKGLILSGGTGSRMRPITHTSAKQLIPVANKPVLFYGIEALVAAGINRIGIVVNPETGGEIREAAGDGSDFGAEFTFIEQDRPGGLAHAMLTAAGFLGDSSFVMYLGDNLLRDGVTGLVERFRQDSPAAGILLARVDDPGEYGVAELEGGRVIGLVEKPEDPPSDLALVGVYLFTSEILDAARTLTPSLRGELEITEAIQVLIDRRRPVTSEVVEGWWKDTGRPDDLLSANRLAMGDLAGRTDGLLERTTVEGPVVIETGATVRDSVIRGPVTIGAGALIENSSIGPFSAVGSAVEITGAEIGDSILMDGSRIRGPLRIEHSLLGHDVVVTGRPGDPPVLRLLLGDRSRIEVAG